MRKQIRINAEDYISGDVEVTITANGNKAILKEAKANGLKVVAEYKSNGHRTRENKPAWQITVGGNKMNYTVFFFEGLASVNNRETDREFPCDIFGIAGAVAIAAWKVAKHTL